MVMVAGFLAGQEVLDVRVLIVVVASRGDRGGLASAMNLAAAWGATGSGGMAKKFWLRPEQLDRLDAFFLRYGGWSVLFAHFLHVGRALMPFLAGAARLPYFRFLIFNAIGCVLWAAIFSLLGYLFGQSWHLIERWVEEPESSPRFLSTMVVVTFWFGGGSQAASWRFANGGGNFERALRWKISGCALPGKSTGWRSGSRRRLLGIHLTVGIFLLLAAVAIFSGLLEQIGTHDWFVAVDFRVAEWFANRSGGPLSTAMSFIAHLGSGFLAGGALAGRGVFCRRERHRLRLLLVAAPGGVLLDFLLKQLFARERPHFGHALGRGMSFGPLDGDLMTATVVYGALAYVLVRSLDAGTGAHWSSPRPCCLFFSWR